MNRPRIILGFIICFTLFISLRTLTSQPRYFYDEALNVEAARNFSTHGKLEIMVSPGVFSGYSHLFNATGYTVTLPLALIFKLSHVSLVYGRLMMTAWLIIAILSIFFVSRAIWDEQTGLFASALIASFAPFYGNGMQIMGEVPGFVFLVWGMYQLLGKHNYKLTGLLFGLAAITKPSMYSLLLPSFLIFLYFFQENRLQKLKNFIFGCVGPMALFLILIVPNIFSSRYWLEMFNLYRNPYDSPSLFHNIISNIQQYWHHSTILYFGFLVLCVAYLFYTHKNSLDLKSRNLFSLALIYLSFLGVYFLRSPGWFRYLVPLEFLTLILIYPAVVVKNRKVANYTAGFLIALNIIQLMFLRGDAKESFAQETAYYLTQQNQSVGIIGALEVASLIPTEQRYQVVKYFGVPELGTNPLLLDSPRPHLIVFKGADNTMVLPYHAILDAHYAPLNQIGSYRIYQLK